MVWVVGPVCPRVGTGVAPGPTTRNQSFTGQNLIVRTVRATVHRTRVHGPRPAHAQHACREPNRRRNRTRARPAARSRTGTGLLVGLGFGYGAGWARGMHVGHAQGAANM